MFQSNLYVATVTSAADGPTHHPYLQARGSKQQIRHQCNTETASNVLSKWSNTKKTIGNAASRPGTHTMTFVTIVPPLLARPGALSTLTMAAYKRTRYDVHRTFLEKYSCTRMQGRMYRPYSWAY